VIVHVAKPEVVYEEPEACPAPAKEPAKDACKERKHFLFHKVRSSGPAVPAGPPPMVASIMMPVPAMVPGIAGPPAAPVAPPAAPGACSASAPGTSAPDLPVLRAAQEVELGVARLEMARAAHDAQTKALEATVERIAPRMSAPSACGSPSRPEKIGPPQKEKKNGQASATEELDEIRSVLADIHGKLEKLKRDHPELFRNK
jgi:hypothetical protein